MTEQDKMELKELWFEISSQERATQSNTLKYFGDVHNELRIGLTEIKTTLTDFKDSTCNHLAKLNGQTAKNTSNINTLRVWRGFITGGLAVVTLILVPLIINYLTH